MCVCVYGVVGADRWLAPCGQRGAALSRGIEGESWRCPVLFSLFLIERCVYFVTLLLLKCSITLLIDAHSVFVSLCTQRLVTLSPFRSLSILLFSFFLLIPKSDSDRWWSCLACQRLPPLLLSPSAPCLFLCSVKQTECQGAPHEYPAPGSDPILLGCLRQCEFFICLKLSGGRESTVRDVDVVARDSTYALTQTLRPHAVQSSLAWNSMFLFIQSPLFAWLSESFFHLK